MCGGRERHQRTHKPNSYCLATGIACLGGRSPLLPKNTRSSTLPILSIQYHFFQRGTDNMWRQRGALKDTQNKIFLSRNRHCLFRRAVRSYQRTPQHQFVLLNIRRHFLTASNEQDVWWQREPPKDKHTHQEEGSRGQALASDSLRSSTVV